MKFWEVLIAEYDSHSRQIFTSYEAALEYFYSVQGYDDYDIYSVELYECIVENGRIVRVGDQLLRKVF